MQSAMTLLLVFVGVLLLVWVAWPRRGPARDLRRIDRYLRRLLAVLVSGVGIALIVTSFVWSVPQPSDVVEVRGHLRSFDVKHCSNLPWFPGESKTWYSTVFTTEEGGLFYNEALNEEVARSALQVPSAALRFYIASTPRHISAEGAQPAYGLWVNGAEIQSLDAALGSERLWVRFGFPVLGIVLIALGYGLWRSRAPLPIAAANRWPSR
jgi:hypothetical protein